MMPSTLLQQPHKQARESLSDKVVSMGDGRVFPPAPERCHSSLLKRVPLVRRGRRRRRCKLRPLQVLVDHIGVARRDRRLIAELRSEVGRRSGGKSDMAAYQRLVSEAEGEESV